MKLLIAILVLICLGACVSELVVLTDDDFEQKFAEKDWIVKFHAPWCRHCKTLKPVFEELGAKVSHAGIGEMDATKHKATAKKYNVTSFPTIIYRQDGVVGKYDGPRTMEGLTAFLDRLNAPAYVEINQLSELDQHATYTDGVIFVLVDQKGDDTASEVKAAFKRAATKLKQHASFAVLSADEGSELAKLGAASILKVERGRAHISMPNVNTHTDEDAIVDFVTNNNFPLVSKYDNHNFKRLSHLPGKYIVAAVVDYRRSETAAIITALEQAVDPSVLSAAGPEVASRFVFGHLDGVKWRTFIKHHRTMIPAILVLDQESDLHQTFPLSVSAEDLPNLKEQLASIVLTLVHTVDDKDRWVASEAPGLLEKLSYRFKSYYPYSLFVVGLPLLFFVFAFLTPYPKEKKVKTH